MLILGDSHTRAYGLNPNFTPVFMGPGKENNFVDWANVDGMLGKCYQIADAMRPASVLLCLGEPDTRYAMGLGWNPWLSDRAPDTDNFGFLDKCVARYRSFHEELTKSIGWTVYVQNVVLTQNSHQCRYIDYYNDLLREAFADQFIFFNDRIRNAEGAIDEGYSWDRIHANNRICGFVEEYFHIDASQSELIPDLVMKKQLRKNSKFNCFEFEKKNEVGLVKRVLGKLL